MHRILFFRANCTVYAIVSIGISNCSTIVSTLRRASAAASTSAGFNVSLAPFTTRIRFCPFGSTKIGATPLDTPSTIRTCFVSMPSDAKFFTVASPNKSFPSLATITTSAPHKRAATAWFAPFPPNPKSNLCPKIVSPGRGNLSLNVVKSTFALPTTAILGTLLIRVPRIKSNAAIYHAATHEQASMSNLLLLLVRVGRHHESNPLRSFSNCVTFAEVLRRKIRSPQSWRFSLRQTDTVPKLWPVALTPQHPNVSLALASNHMRAVDLIRKKRDSGEHSRDEIDYLISAYTRDEIPDYQMAAWLMAAWLRGLSRAELASLTEAMLHSGEVVDHSYLPAKKVDKHSTGGVGDKTSLILAPIVAAGGLAVPMISGRGLGHTGGTLDKLEAIPGFNTSLTLADFKRVLRECGMALIGQTAEIAPADKKIYALRDATSTVENIGLICASIMSKKLAEGIDALVLDRTTRYRAFMRQEEDSVALAEVMVDTAKRLAKKCLALITDMGQPLGRFAGHSNEVIESIEILKGRGATDLRDLSLELSAWMFFLGERTKTLDEGRALANEMVISGKALEKFRDCIRLQGGNPRVIDDPSLLPAPRSRLEVKSPSSGFITDINCLNLGIALAMLGGGREKKEQNVDHAVGLEFHKRIGDSIKAGETLVTIAYNADAQLHAAQKIIEASYQIGDKKPPARPLIRRIIGG